MTAPISPKTAQQPVLAPTVGGSAAGDDIVELPRDPRALRATVSMPQRSERLIPHALPAPAPVQDLVQAALRCPISGELMTAAVLLRDGRSYQKGPALQDRLSQDASWPPALPGYEAHGEVPNDALRAVCARVQAGEKPQPTWEEFKCSHSPEALFLPVSDAHGRTASADVVMLSVHGDAPTNPAAGSLQSFAESLPLPNRALERVIDLLLAADLPVHAAVLRGNVTQLPVAAVRNVCNQTDAHGQTALALAAKYGEARAVKYLVKLGASVILTNRAGQTPLLLAIERGHSAAVAHLAATRQGLELADAFGMFPLLLAAVTPQPQMIGTLCQYGANVMQRQPSRLGRDSLSPLQAAVMVGSREAVRELRQYDADANEPRPPFKSPLLMAVSSGRFDLQEALLAAPTSRLRTWFRR